MNIQIRPFFVILSLVMVAALSGCTSAPAEGGVVSPPAENAVHSVKVEKTAMTTRAGTATAQTESIAEQLASVKSDNRIWLEAYRMFSNMKETEYVHPPYTVDEAAGIYRFDCLGFVDHVLMNADPASYKEIGRNVNPSIESYSAYFHKASATTPDALGWTNVAHPLDLRAGDICLWLKPSTLDTGHMWIIAGEPKINPERNDEVLVRIFDSSLPHADDSRTGSVFGTGLGSGIRGRMVDSGGNPIGLFWEGGVSSAAGERDTTITCGRLNR